MKKSTGKLKLHRETLGSLQESSLREAAGRRQGPTAIDCSVTCLAPDQTSYNCL
jgi:hypothetical protein